MRFAGVIVLIVLLGQSAESGVIFSYPPSEGGGLIASSWVDPDGSDSDMYAYESFVLDADRSIKEVHWRGGYIYSAQYGKVQKFSIYFYESIAGESQPHCGNPDMEETVYLARYFVGDNAGETYVGTFGGVKMYDYAFVLPKEFKASANTKYWIRIEGYQPTYPDWGICVGTGGNNSHFHFSTGWARFYFGQSDTSFALIGPIPVPGDMNCDDSVDFNDIDAFVTALTSRKDYESQFPNCLYLNADINADGSVDFNDIDGFVDCLINGGCQ